MDKRRTYTTLMALARAPSGEVRVGVWDRFTTWGPSKKDGQETTFDEVTTRQILDNFRRRGLLVPMDFNHQSYKVDINGQPAVSLARYGALAVVRNGELLGMEALSGVVPAPLDEQTRGDGVYGYRVEVTPRGHEVLPNMLYISPAFNPNGTDEQGNPCGYVLECVAATDVPFQGDRGDGAPQITFALGGRMDRSKIDEMAKELKRLGGEGGYGQHESLIRNRWGGDFSDALFRQAVERAEEMALMEGTKMRSMTPEMMARMGLEVDADDEKTKAAFARRMDQGRAMMGRRAMGETMKPDDMRMMAKQFEDEAQVYEDNYGAEQMAEGMEPVHVTMRKMAAQLMKMADDMAGSAQPHQEPDGDEGMIALQELARKRGINPAGKSATVLHSLIDASLAAPPPASVTQEDIRRMIAEERAREEKLAETARATQMFARVPQSIPPAARAAVQGQLKSDPKTAIVLMESWGVQRVQQFGRLSPPAGGRLLSANSSGGQIDPEAEASNGTLVHRTPLGMVKAEDGRLAAAAQRYVNFAGTQGYNPKAGRGQNPVIFDGLKEKFGDDYEARLKAGELPKDRVFDAAYTLCAREYPHLVPEGDTLNG